ncbi:MAG: indole-3-glycerol phosphate synthase TrpC [Oscillospiraceae bacterium]|nr:indole-3-glycerol phosphate synthase TrpC [Oscillospiraceae bacterium]
MSILDEIVAATKLRVQREKAASDTAFAPAPTSAPMATTASSAYPFEAALRKPGFHFICEVKKASPSKGIIAEDYPYLEIAKEYETAGATAISVLTETDFFLGSPQHLSEIRNIVNIPLLRKDFIIDLYQVEQAALMGADAILLICAILNQSQLAEFIETADTYGMSSLVEVHDESELKNALQARARIIGANNRDLNTFEVDMENSIKLRKLAPDNVLFVSESGIQTPEDIAKLKENGINAVLIGETLMRAKDKKEALSKLGGII